MYKQTDKFGNDIVSALDRTSIKVANQEELMQHKWHVKKGGQYLSAIVLALSSVLMIEAGSAKAFELTEAV
jgi:hypothetical protein